MSRGPMWPRRLELMLANLTAVLVQVNGGKAMAKDFDLFKPPESPVGSVIEVVAQFTGTTKRAARLLRKKQKGARNG